MNVAAFRKDHIPALDGLRAFAVLLVLWQHVPPLALPLLLHRLRSALGGDVLAGDWPLAIDWLRDQFFGAGYLGVDVFFVLSGFLITRILLVDKLHGGSLRHFFVRRFVRIFPIYYLTIAVVWIVAPHPELPWCAAYLSNFYYFHGRSGVLGHSWSLAVEEHFYLVWPLLVFGLSTAQSRRTAAWIVIPAAVLCSLVLAVASTDLAFVLESSQRGTMYRMGSLAAGAVLAYHENGLRARPGRTLALAAALLAIGTAVRVPLGVEAIGTGRATSRLVGFGLTSTALVLACLGGHALGSRFARWLGCAPLRFIGRISYGLYLYHYVVFHWTGLYATVGDVEQVSVAWLLAKAIGITFAIATVSYYLVERPLLKWAGRFRRP